MPFSSYIYVKCSGHLPAIVREQTSVPLKPQEILPERMKNNKLHRYSKVLESNIGDVYNTRQLPACNKVRPRVILMILLEARIRVVYFSEIFQGNDF